MPKKSDFVRVQLLRPQGILSLCEVEVHGWELNRYESEGIFILKRKQTSLRFQFNVIF
jgi:hypothetical protein